MSSYIKEGKPLEIDNAPDWLVGYMKYRLTIENNTKEAVMTYFKGLREFCQWASYQDRSGRNPPSEEILRSEDILLLQIDPLLRLTRSDIEAYLYYLADTLDNSASTRNKKLVIVRGFYEYVIDHQQDLNVEFEVNPAGRIKRPKPEKKKPDTLTEEEQQKLIECLDHKIAAGDDNAVRNKAIVLLYLVTGIRLNEATRLNVGDINLKEGSIRILGKGAKTRIIYPGNDHLIAAMQTYLDCYRNRLPDLDTPAFFVSQQKKDRLVGRTIEEAFKKLCREAGIGDKHVHGCRHTAATTLAREGNSSVVLKEFLGHEDIGTTQIYTHITNLDVQKAVRNSSLSELGSRTI